MAKTLTLLGKALTLLRQLHYQICNGGFAQACGNGCIDKLAKYGMDKFREDLAKEYPLTTEEGKTIDTMCDLISEAMASTNMQKECGYCNGTGQITYSEENDDGEEVEGYECCPDCNGDGTIMVESFADVEFSYTTDNSWDDEWDAKYYEKVSDEIIDRITNQSHTHSVVLDAINATKETA